MFELVFLNGARAGVTVSITNNMTAGRSPECQLEVPDPNSSRRHVTFYVRRGQLVVKDLQSANGAFVNEDKMTECALESGDILRMGETRMRIQKSHFGSMSQSDSSIFGTGFRMREEAAADDVNLSMSLSMTDLPYVQGQNIDAVQQKLNAIIEISSSLANIAKLEDLYGPVIDGLFKVFPQVDRGFLLLGDRVSDLNPVSVRQRGSSADRDLTVSRSLCYAALEKKSILVYQDGGDADFEEGMSLVSLNIRSAMVIPLMVKEEILGLVLIDTPDRRRSFLKEDMELAAAVCAQVAISIKNALLFEQNEKDIVQRQNLMRFLPKPVADQCLEGTVDVGLGGKTYNGTIFFSDIVGFTKMSDGMSPEEIIGTMNGYFNRMVPCIEDTDGAIDKFMGDAIMAFWGIPFDEGRSAYKAVTAALHMQTVLATYNALQRKEAKPELKMGIGLNTGEVVAGNIGSANRVEYTVLGSTVNVAQRLESSACPDQILVGSTTWAALNGEAYAISMPPLYVKNVAAAQTTYSIRGLKLEGGEKLLHIPVLIAGVRAYIIRELQDGSFTVLHSASSRIADEDLIIDAAECHGVSLGKPSILLTLPQQEMDCGLVRSLVTVTDTTLAGILSTGEIKQCELAWSEMSRSQVCAPATTRLKRSSSLFTKKR